MCLALAARLDKCIQMRREDGDHKAHFVDDVVLDQVHAIESCGRGHRALRQRGERGVQQAAHAERGAAPPRVMLCHCA
jgi:hypothetical protein